MSRTFLSLYFLIVFSVVLVGWGADRLWQVYNPEPEVGPFEALFYRMIDERMQGLNFTEAERESDSISQELSLDITIYRLEELAKSNLAERILKGGIVSVYDDQGRMLSYKRIANSDHIVSIRLAHENSDHRRLYIFLLIAFYAIMAIVIYFWIWPLSCDLRKLQQYTQEVGLGVVGKVDLGHRSAVYSLAEAFNKMSARIHELLTSHKEMTYAVSHELRTPLARMKFALEMAKDSNNVDMKDKQISSVREDVAEMDTLINELLAYAAFEQKNQQLDIKSGDMRALVENIVASNVLGQKTKRIEVNIECQHAAEDMKCEWYLFERCLQNLIQNAFKFAQQKVGVHIMQNDTHYKIIVEDDGLGIAPEDREKVLQAFVRLRNHENDNKSGFGLGLAIVKRIMKWHKGEVAIEESELGGAKFILCWPNRV